MLPLLILTQSFPLETMEKLKPEGAEVKPAMHRGLKGIYATPKGAENGMVMLEGVSLENGTIELEISGSPGAQAGGGARGFVGVAFHVADAKRYEAFYLRPTNGRADDQVRRNHSAQYISHPDWPWQRLRKEFPETFESYVDLEPGVWTKVRVELNGGKARLYVHGAAQPTLVVNDVKAGGGTGVALWIGPGTDAHFRNVTVVDRK
ncbi:MAG: LamG domain-containing protein [Acidobacteria bacterium]|nr:LamG domain-containing protein [Acidobacteriota bacterium]